LTKSRLVKRQLSTVNPVVAHTDREERIRIITARERQLHESGDNMNDRPDDIAIALE
jgi:hypothetical protein